MNLALYILDNVLGAFFKAKITLFASRNMI